MLFMSLVSILFFYTFPSVEAERDGDVRLVGGKLYGEGRVEVYSSGSWGTICQEGWDLVDAQVICRQLRFQNGAKQALLEPIFGKGPNNILLRNVDCLGSESNLLECNNVQGNLRPVLSNCEAGVGVRCNAPNYEGCFGISQLSRTTGTQLDDLSIEECFIICSTLYNYIALHNEDNCDCLNDISDAEPILDMNCNIPCSGNRDQICGGTERASIYKIKVNLPYITTSGFPAMINVDDTTIQETFPTTTTTINYRFIEIVQFDIPSGHNVIITDSVRTVNVEGGTALNRYEIFSVNPISITYQPEKLDLEYFGFAFRLGEGVYCPAVSTVLNGGDIGASGVEPYAVGVTFNLICDGGYKPYDNQVYCREDGTLNRPLRCDPVIVDPPTMPSIHTNVSPPAQEPLVSQISVISTTPQPITAPTQMIANSITGKTSCRVPVVENGNVNTEGTQGFVDVGETLTVTCNVLFDAQEVQIICQRNGTFDIEEPMCERQSLTLIIIFIGGIVVLVLLFVMLVIIIVCCSCYFIRKKKRRVKDFNKRNRVASNQGNLGFSDGNNIDDNVRTTDDFSVILGLPGDELPIPSRPSTPPLEYYASLPNPTGNDHPLQQQHQLEEDEANALNTLYEAVESMETAIPMYEKVV